MRLIDADALIEKLKQHHDFFVTAWGGFKEMPLSDKARCDELSNSIAEIFNAPTIDAVEVVHGKWRRKMIDSGFNIDWVCSRCGYRVMTDFVSYNYCPNCGADMRKGADDEVR